MKQGIYFDLDTKEMGNYMANVPRGYYDLQKSFANKGFFHRQGSGYISKEDMNRNMAVAAIEEITQENPWLTKCVKKIDVADIDNEYDLVGLVKSVEVPELKTLAELKAERVQQAQPQTESPALQALRAAVKRQPKFYGASNQASMENVEE